MDFGASLYIHFFLKDEATSSKAAKQDGDQADGACASKPEIATPADEKEIEEEEGEILAPFENWPSDVKENIREKFLVQMPLDFYAFWKFCKIVNRENPREAFLETAGIRLVGPYDLMPDSKVRKVN